MRVLGFGKLGGGVLVEVRSVGEGEGAGGWVMGDG